MGIRLFEAPLSQVVAGSKRPCTTRPLAMTGEMDVGVVARPVGEDLLVVAIPARHLAGA